MLYVHYSISRLFWEYNGFFFIWPVKSRFLLGILKLVGSFIKEMSGTVAKYTFPNLFKCLLCSKIVFSVSCLNKKWLQFLDKTEFTNL